MIRNDQEAAELKTFIDDLKAFLKPETPPLTEDAIHNWDAPYIARQYGDLPDEIKAEVRAAMQRHHRQGTSARDEAKAINARFGLS